MNRLRTRLARIPNFYLIVFVALTDALMLLGVAPFELYTRSRIVAHTANESFLFAALAANLALMLLLGTAMFVSSLLIARGVKRAARVTLPVVRSRGARARSKHSGY